MKQIKHFLDSISLIKVEKLNQAVDSKGATVKDFIESTILDEEIFKKHKENIFVENNENDNKSEHEKRVKEILGY